MRTIDYIWISFSIMEILSFMIDGTFLLAKLGYLGIYDIVLWIILAFRSMETFDFDKEFNHDSEA